MKKCNINILQLIHSGIAFFQGVVRVSSRDFPSSVRTAGQNVRHVQFHLPSVEQGGFGFVAHSHHVLPCDFGGAPVLLLRRLLLRQLLLLLLGNGCSCYAATNGAGGLGQVVSFVKIAQLAVSTLEH